MISTTIKGAVSSIPELKVTQTGKPFTTFKLDVAGYNQELGIPETKTVHIKTWNELAEDVDAHIRRGSEVSCVGRWETRDYTDRNGDPRKWTEFIAFEINSNGVKLGTNGFTRSADSFIPDTTTDGGYSALGPQEEASVGSD